MQHLTSALKIWHIKTIQPLQGAMFSDSQLGHMLPDYWKNNKPVYMCIKQYVCRKPVEDINQVFGSSKSKN